MWMRKTDQQMTRERSRVWLSFRGPAWLFLICFLAFIATAIQGPGLRGHVWSGPESWPEAFFGATVIGAVAAVIHYALQLVLRRRLDPLATHVNVVICDACYRVKRRDGESTCECGGTFEDFDNWTWDDSTGPEVTKRDTPD
jgi:hypothetical protein